MTDWLININVGDISNIKSNIDKVITKTKKEDLSLWTTRGENANQYMFNLNDIEDTINIIKENIEKEMAKNNRHVKLKPISAWCVVGEKHSYHMLHQHNAPQKNTDVGIAGDNAFKQNHIASVLYLSVADKTLHNTGDFYFLLNQGDYIKYHQLSPEVGDLTFFPTHIMHGTYPQGEGIRQSLNIDFEEYE